MYENLLPSSRRMSSQKIEVRYRSAVISILCAPAGRRRLRQSKRRAPQPNVGRCSSERPHDGAQVARCKIDWCQLLWTAAFETSLYANEAWQCRLLYRQRVWQELFAPRLESGQRSLRDAPQWNQYLRTLRA